MLTCKPKSLPQTIVCDWTQSMVYSCCCEYLHKEMQKTASTVQCITVYILFASLHFITPCKRCSPVVLAPLSIWLAVASLTSVNYRQAEQWKVLRLMYYVYVYTYVLQGALWAPSIPQDGVHQNEIESSLHPTSHSQNFVTRQ